MVGVTGFEPAASSSEDALCNIKKSIASRCSLGIFRVAAAADRLASSAKGQRFGGATQSRNLLWSQDAFLKMKKGAPVKVLRWSK
jgi:hypothetical protein